MRFCVFYGQNITFILQSSALQEPSCLLMNPRMWLIYPTASERGDIFFFLCSQFLFCSSSMRVWKVRVAIPAGQSKFCLWQELIWLQEVSGLSDMQCPKLKMDKLRNWETHLVLDIWKNWLLSTLAHALWCVTCEETVTVL